MDQSADSSAVPQVGQWLLSLPLIAPVREYYVERRTMFDTTMLRYLAETPLIDDDDRERIKDDCEWWLRQTNARQAWFHVIERYRDAISYVLLWPLVPVAATVTMSYSVADPPTGWRLAHLVLGVLFTLGALSGSLRHADFAMPRPSGLFGLAFLVVSGLLLYGPWTEAGWLPVTGALLLASTVGLIVALAGVFVLDIRRIRTRAAVFLVVQGALAVVTLAVGQGDGAGWAGGLWSGLWAGLTAMVVAGFVFVLTYLITSLLERRKMRVWTVGELVQTLIWFGARAQDAHLPLEERSALGQAFPFSDPVGVAWELEWLARLIERCLPRQLTAWDPMGDRMVAERCRGIAARLRELKMEFLLRQSTPAHEIAARLVPAVVPIIDGDWDRLETAEVQVVPHSRLRLVLRGLGGAFVAIAPLAVFLLLRTTTSVIPDSIVDQVLPIAVTWLLLSIIAWIDPGTGSRSGKLRNLTDLLPGSRS
ncbi:hypothetical protein [Acrocarpospora catenulata]|uniref:hypothetical protein n=1 Tax=Acrocarpospora catenulata TaxID=2836182 RepID=UPI001BDA376D|nr:hypothetical protein [Acrocarpospora catenulata]